MVIQNQTFDKFKQNCDAVEQSSGNFRMTYKGHFCHMRIPASQPNDPTIIQVHIWPINPKVKLLNHEGVITLNFPKK
jgi:hypothetical protein